MSCYLKQNLRLTSLDYLIILLQLILFPFFKIKKAHICKFSLMFSSGFRFLQALHFSIHHFCPTRMVEIIKKKKEKLNDEYIHHSYLVQSSRTFCIHPGGGTLLALHFPSLYPIWMSGPPTFPLRLIKLPSFIHFVLYVLLPVFLFVLCFFIKKHRLIVSSSYVSRVLVGFGNF